MGALPDEIIQFTKDNWAELGLTPVLLFRLTERGWSYCDINNALTILIGVDYNKVKTTVWIERLEAIGIEFPEDDSEPFIEILDRLVFAALSETFLCASC